MRRQYMWDHRWWDRGTGPRADMSLVEPYRLAMWRTVDEIFPSPDCVFSRLYKLPPGRQLRFRQYEPPFKVNILHCHPVRAAVDFLLDSMTVKG